MSGPLDPAVAAALFAPSQVALIGVSADPAKTTARPLRYLRRHGYRGRIVPVNPRRSEIDGLTCYPTLVEAPPGTEHALLLCAADAVPEALEDCVRAGVRVATVLSGGFGEAGEEGRRREDRVRRIVDESGLRLLGPNSLGIINTAGMALSANAILESASLLQGRLSVVSQSGSMIGAMVSQGAARGIGFAKLISIGNEVDLSVGEVGASLVEDARTDVVLLFLEAIRNRDDLAAFAALAHRRGKPVLAYKLGRSVAGQALATSHTGALAGSDAAARALLDDLGIALVDSFETLIEAPGLFRGRRPVPGRRVAVVTTTGGGAAMLIDCLGAAGLELAETPAATRRLLRDAGIAPQSYLIDLTLAGAKPQLVRAVIADLLAEPQIDAVVMVVGSSARFHPELAVEPLVVFTQAGKPFGVYLVPHAERSATRLAEAGLACFRTPEACADGIRAALGWHPPVARPSSDRKAADRARERLAAVPVGTVLSEPDARQVLGALGLRFPGSALAADADGAVEVARRIGYPVVAKIASPDIPHKSDVGGVALGLADARALHAAVQEMLRRLARSHPDARIDGVLVERMQRGLGEALVGYRHDAQSGPTVVLGAGGVLAEIHRDVTVRPAPVDRATALAMIAEIRGLAPLGGFRGLPRGDLDALADVVVRLSQLAALETVAEAEINPVLIGAEGSGVVLVDALVRRLPAAGPDPQRQAGLKAAVRVG